MSEANKQAALDFIHAMSDADVARQDALLAPDAFTNTMGFGQVSGRRDRATMLATAGAFEQLVPTGFRPTIEKVVAEGDFVAVEWRGDAVLCDGTPYGNEYVFMFTFENGKIKQLNEYFCTVLADRTIGRLLAGMGEAVAPDEPR